MADKKFTLKSLIPPTVFTFFVCLLFSIIFISKSSSDAVSSLPKLPAEDTNASTRTADQSQQQTTTPSEESDIARALAPRSDEESQIINTYKSVNRAVVNISTQTAAMDFFGPVYQDGSGSGVVVDEVQGLVVTNFHVITNARRISVTLYNGQSYGVTLVGQDADHELALLKIVDPPENLVAARLGDSSVLEVGQRVLAIGNPFGLNRTLTTGIISSLARTIRSENGRLIEDVIQTDAAINPGNSGGPLIDTAGRVIGLNTAIISRSGESAGIGFAIPVNAIKSALPQLIKFGKVLRPKIGVVVVDTEYGPALLFVQPDGPADKAGLQGARQAVRKGYFSGYVVDLSMADFILALNGQKVRSKAEVLDTLGRVEGNAPIELEIRRGVRTKKSRTVKVKPILD